jgi:hypothetical protein
MKSYVIQPYRVGSKNGKSLALIIPARVAKECDISSSTVFSVRMNADSRTISLQQTGHLEKQEDRKESKPAEQGFNMSTQRGLRIQ